MNIDRINMLQPTFARIKSRATRTIKKWLSTGFAVMNKSGLNCEDNWQEDAMIKHLGKETYNKIRTKRAMPRAVL